MRGSYVFGCLFVLWFILYFIVGLLVPLQSFANSHSVCVWFNFEVYWTNKVRDKIIVIVLENHKISENSLSLFMSLTHFSRETPKRVIDKNCRPRSAATECSI